MVRWLICIPFAPFVLLPVESELLLHSSGVLEEGLLVPARVDQRASLLFSGRCLLGEVRG